MSPTVDPSLVRHALPVKNKFDARGLQREQLRLPVNHQAGVQVHGKDHETPATIATESYLRVRREWLTFSGSCIENECASGSRFRNQHRSWRLGFRIGEANKRGKN